MKKILTHQVPVPVHAKRHASAPGILIITVSESPHEIHCEQEVGLFFFYENGSRMLVKDITSEPHFISGWR
jgi:hypothetical protein